MSLWIMRRYIVCCTCNRTYGTNIKNVFVEWDRLCDIANPLLFYFVKQNEDDAKDCVEEDVMEVEMEMLRYFEVFYSHAIILVFIDNLL